MKIKSWEKEFDEKFTTLYSDEHHSQFASTVDETDNVKFFISFLLFRQKQEILKEVKKMKLKINCDGSKQTLKDVIKLLEEE